MFTESTLTWVVHSSLGHRPAQGALLISLLVIPRLDEAEGSLSLAPSEV